MAKRKRYLMVCVNRRSDDEPRGSCAARGAEELYKELKNQLKSSGLAQLEARPCSASCLDVCWAGPVVLVEPDHYFYGRVSVSDVPDIVRALENDERVERLVLSQGDFLEPKELRALPVEEQERLKAVDPSDRRSI